VRPWEIERLTWHEFETLAAACDELAKEEGA